MTVVFVVSTTGKLLVLQLAQYIYRIYALIANKNIRSRMFYTVRVDRSRIRLCKIRMNNTYITHQPIINLMSKAGFDVGKYSGIDLIDCC